MWAFEFLAFGFYPLCEVQVPVDTIRGVVIGRSSLGETHSMNTLRMLNVQCVVRSRT